MQDSEKSTGEDTIERKISGTSLDVLLRGDYTLCRSKAKSGEKRLLVISTSEATALSNRLQHELGLKTELDPDWAALPIALEQHKGRVALALQDPGGILLSRLIGRPLDATKFLQIA